MWYGCVEMYSNGRSPCCSYVRDFPPPERNRCAGAFEKKEDAEAAARALYKELRDAETLRLNSEYWKWQNAVYNAAGIRIREGEA